MAKIMENFVRMYKNKRQPLSVDNPNNETHKEDHTSMESHLRELDGIQTIYPEVDVGTRAKVEKFMKQPIIENGVLTLIVINSIMMGLSTFSFISNHQPANVAFYYSDLVFLIIFTVEVSLTIFYRRTHALTDLWVVFDFLIIVLSWTLSSIENFDPLGGDTNSVQVIRSLRIFRILSRIESLKVVLTALSRSIPSLGCLAIFLLIIMFIFAILFTETYGDLYENGDTDVDYFSRLDLTFFTLYQILTLDEWSNILRQVQETRPLAWIPFLIYVIFTAFIIVNLVIAIICESIFTINSSDCKIETMTRDMKDLERLMNSMRYEVYDYLKLPTNYLVMSDTEGDESKLESEDDNSRGHLLRQDADVSAPERPSLANQHENGAAHEPEQNEPPTFWSIMKGYLKPADELIDTKRTLCGRFVNNDHVQTFLVLLIIVNSITLALGTFSFVKDDPSVNSAFETTSTVFLVVYTIETILQLVYHGLHLFKDRWLAFDFALIVFSWGFQLSPSFRAIRVLRIVHVLPKFDAMRTITETLSKAIPKIGAISGITLVFFYVFAVMFTTLFKDIPVGDGGFSFDYFSRLDRSLLTLFQLMTMAEWASVSREIAVHHWWGHILTTSFVTISGLLFVNAIVALICQAQEQVITKKSNIRRLKKRRSGFDKSYDDRVFDIKAMHTEIVGLLNMSDPQSPFPQNDTDDDDVVR